MHCNLRKLALALMAGAVTILPSLVAAHGVSAVLDPVGDRPSFTALARVTCFDDGNGPAAYLVARIRDTSPPVEGLYISLHMLKGSRAISVTDTISGDADYSPFVSLEGGSGVYQVMLTKTREGARAFDVEYHCMALGNIHTGTDVIVDQYQ